MMPGVLLLMALATSPGHAADDPTKSVEELASKGFELAKKGKYNEAIAAYSKAYQLIPAASLLYNIGAICDRRLQERDLAADYYRRYLRAPDADPELSKRAAARLQAIEEHSKSKVGPPVLVPVAAPAPAVAPPTPPPPPQSSPPETRQKLWGALPHWVNAKNASLALSGAGAATIVTGLGFGLSARSANNQALRQYCSGTLCWDQRGVALTDRAKTAATVATVCTTVGVAALAGGTWLYLRHGGLSSPGPTGPSLSVMPSVTSTSAGVFVAGELR